MKFMKGIVIGGLVSAGIMMMYKDELQNMNKKKMMKKGKQFMKKMGMI
ncbi:MAG TPA: hypothetical protein IAB70_05950 [Candidatus Merdicola faecigallinarum]|uniref:DUF3918 domain-containing protein n=1 Tax=Candidatus Merdicola faecigallinarum TaxID=2840862 RepID=A0A9D1M1Z8_9FIRM|nr:hypothetical protein [Candidatus Merdicola faecigallinarum]